jgi:Flp pilus assembly protein TadG
MAIVLPLLLLILFGIIDFGLMLNRQILLTEAAREGARAAALGGSDDDVNAAIARVLGSTPPTATSVQRCPADLASAHDAAATVELRYRYAAETPLGSMMLIFGSGVGDTFDLKATGAMACVG